MAFPFQRHFVATALLTALALPALAQPAPAATGDHGSHHGHHGAAPAAAPASQNDLSEGEITRWDPRALKVTLRHGEIKNLDMPPMTMVFQVQDRSLLARAKPGDRVRFTADKVNGQYTVLQLEPAS